MSRVILAIVATFALALNAMAAPLVGWSPSLAQFGGDGYDGAVTKGAVTETDVKQFNTTTFTQSGSTTYVPVSGSNFNSARTQDWNGTTNVGNNANGGPNGTLGAGNTNSSFGAGGGPGGGMGAMANSGTNAAGGGGGGGFGGDGGRGGNGSDTGGNGGSGGHGGKAYPAACFAGGSGGGGGGDGAGTGGAGGAGGGSIRICGGGNVTIGSGASINANGANGTAGVGGESGGGAGGSGGYIGIYTQGTLTRTGNIVANGGDGGAAAAATGGEGAGGGGGRVIQMAPTISGAGTVTVNGGQGDGNTGVNGVDGGAGVSVSITGMPNLPLIAHLERTDAIDRLAVRGETVWLTHEQLADTFAQLYARPGKTDQLKYALLYGTSMRAANFLSVIDCTGIAPETYPLAFLPDRPQAEKYRREELEAA